MKVGDIVRPRFGHLLPAVEKTKTAKTFRINQEMFLFQIEREQEFKVTRARQVEHPDPSQPPFNVIQLNGQEWSWCEEDWEVVDPNAPPAPQPTESSSQKPPSSQERMKALGEISQREKVYVARDEVVPDLSQLINDSLLEIRNRHGGANTLELQAAVDQVIRQHREQAAGGQEETVLIPIAGVIEVKVRRGP